MGQHMCPPRFLEFYSVLTAQMKAPPHSGGVGLDPDCHETSQRADGFVVDFPSMGTVDDLDWPAFLQTCAEVPPVARRLAVAWLGKTGVQPSPPQVLTVSRRYGRDFLNKAELIAYLDELCGAGWSGRFCESTNVEFDYMPWYKQLSHMVRTNALIAFHGAAAGVHEVWMPSGSVIVEFQPVGAWSCTTAYCTTAQRKRDMLYVLSTTSATEPAAPLQAASPLPSSLPHLGPSYVAFHQHHHHRRVVGLQAVHALGNSLQQLQQDAFRGYSLAAKLRHWVNLQTGAHNIIRGACFGAAIQIYEH